jgi:MGT family glycosyltransferase
LNIVCILKALQPQPELLGNDFTFVGFPAPLHQAPTEKKVIYVSMGTVLTGDAALYRTFLNVLREVDIQAILSVGSKVNIAELPAPPDHIRLSPFVDQVAVLREAVLFISHGGMASVHEAIHTLTPMIVIPVIPEQQITAERIQELGIGLHIPAEQLSESRLRAAIEEILRNRDQYVHTLRALVAAIPPVPPQVAAAGLIGDFMNRVRAQPIH